MLKKECPNYLGLSNGTNSDLIWPDSPFLIGSEVL